jgi:hypothetical protein
LQYIPKRSARQEGYLFMCYIQMMIAVWSRKHPSSAGRSCSVQNILATTVDMTATNPGPINKY